MSLIARTKGEARSLGLDTYLPKLPCKKCGEHAERWAISKQCVKCQPMPRTKAAVTKMRNAYNHSLHLTIKTGILYVPIPKDDEWWAIPVRDQGVAYDGTEAAPVRYDGD